MRGGPEVRSPLQGFFLLFGFWGYPGRCPGLREVAPLALCTAVHRGLLSICPVGAFMDARDQVDAYEQGEGGLINDVAAWASEGLLPSALG